MLYAECQISVQSSQLSQSIKSYLIAIKAEKAVHQSVIQHYSQLELNSHNNVILQFLQTQSLSAFSELRTYSHAFQCTVSDCRKVFLSRQNIRKHAQSNHNTHYENISTADLSAQSLEPNRRFFIITLNNASSSEEAIISDVNNNQSNIIQSDSVMQEAVNQFLHIYTERKNLIAEKSSVMQLNHSKSEMSAFQMQTNYLKFLHKRDIKVLSDSVISCNKSDSLYL